MRVYFFGKHAITVFRLRYPILMSGQAQHFINLLGPYIHLYGYWVALFGMMIENAGIPVPGETSLIVVTFFAAQGALKIWLVLPLALLGDIIGDSLGYAIGRFGGRPAAERWGRFVRLDTAKLTAAEELFADKGGRTVFASQFSSVTRLTGSIAAGLAGMPYRRFILFDSLAAALLVGMIGGATYYFGQNIDAVLRLFHGIRILGLAVVAAVVGTFFFRYFRPLADVNRRQLAEIIFVSTGVAITVGLLYYAVTTYIFLVP